MAVKRFAKRALAGRVLPGVCPICGVTLFDERGPWLRDEYHCRRCWSIPRHRALIYVLSRVSPDWPELTIYESSPGHAVSALLARRCQGYVSSNFWEDRPLGTIDADGVRCEDIRHLTFEDDSFDLVITGDVFEHVVAPGDGFREIARVLKPGGKHVFTVPIFSGRATLVRVADDGTELAAPDYHGNLIGDGKSLVVREWGDDVVSYIETEARTPTQRFHTTSRWHGIRGEMTDVLVSTVPT